MEETNPLRILLIADGRSPITRRWITMLNPLGHHISLVSSYPCPPLRVWKTCMSSPWHFQALAAARLVGQGQKVLLASSHVSARPLKNCATGWVHGRSVSSQANYSASSDAEKPDILHAMRIPFEGMLASLIPPGTPA